MRKGHAVQCGFTLIELMIAVAVVAILTSLAYPSFTEHLRKSRRAEAQQTLMEVASRQQQHLLDTRDYAASLAATGAHIPSSVQTHYALGLTVVSASTGTAPAFTVTATPLGSQAQDACGTLGLTHGGIKTPVNCW